MGFALFKLRDYDAALEAYRAALKVYPNDAEILINFGNILIELAKNKDALPVLEQVCELKPDLAVSWNTLAHCCYLIGLHEKGFQAALCAEAHAKNDYDRAVALKQKAIHRRELGQIKEAIADTEASIALIPFDPGNHTNRLLFLLSDPDADAHQLAAAAKAYAQCFEAPLVPQWPDHRATPRQPWQTLNVGFLSPDFRVHSVMYFVEGLLANLDRRQFTVTAFYLYPSGDHVTDRVRGHVDHFVELAGQTPDEQFTAIRSRDIHILIDLAGHTGHNGLQAMARKPAPVQVSWLGFPATTGLQAIDYKITDDITDPPDAADQYTEQLVRLPTLFACYRPMSRDPLWRYQPRYAVAPTPALRNGVITFGSCNNLGKLTDDVLRLWGQILARVPDSRLLLEGKNFEKPAFAERYLARCESLGLPPGRLDLVPLSTANQYLTYHRIDIALDPFPLTGGTTSFDLLWMGVPMVSMKGQVFKSRMGMGILHTLGLAEWLADDAQQYIDIAVRLAQDVTQLDGIRQSLRPHMERSALMDEPHFTRCFERALRQMWLQHCDTNEHDAAPAPDWWHTPPPPEVGMAEGQRIPLAAAHDRLSSGLAVAKAAGTQSGDGRIHSAAWADLTRLAERVLCAQPHDPVALACLAEIEMAHGNEAFGARYLKLALESVAQQAPAPFEEPSP